MGDDEEHSWAASLAGLDLNLLHVFRVVYRERSVSQAARILSVSQSAVSHALGRLRDQLGAPLFEQQGRGLVPTPWPNASRRRSTPR